MSDDGTWHDGDVHVEAGEPLDNKAAHTPFQPDDLFSGTFSEQRDDKES